MVLIALTAALLLCGCTFQQAQSQPATTADGPRLGRAQAEARPDLPEPCALLTQADLATVLAEPFQAGEAGAVPATAGSAFIPKNCAFQSGDKQIVLTLFPAIGPYAAQKDWAAYTQTLQAVAGLGDDAFWETDTNELWVVRGQVTLALGFDFMEASPEVATPLAQRALRRLTSP
jgi:hypothetical protein